MFNIKQFTVIYICINRVSNTVTAPKAPILNLYCQIIVIFCSVTTLTIIPKTINITLPLSAHEEIAPHTPSSST